MSSPMSATKQDDASKRCPDLIVQSITLPSVTKADGTVLQNTALSGQSYTFSAVIKNQGEGTDATKTFLNQISVNGEEVPNPPPNRNQPISGGLAQNATRSVTSGSWTAATVTTATTRTIEVCADRPPVAPGEIQEAPPEGIPPGTFADNPAENNNCASANTAITRTLTIVPPITVELECEKAGGTYDKNYCIIDYANTSKLRWSVSGNPSACRFVSNSDKSGAVTPQSYTADNNPLSLGNLLNKLFFQYQLTCER